MGSVFRKLNREAAQDTVTSGPPALRRTNAWIKNVSHLNATLPLTAVKIIFATTESTASRSITVIQEEDIAMRSTSVISFTNAKTTNVSGNKPNE